MAKKNMKKKDNIDNTEKKNDVEEMEIDFPRGGESSLTPMEYRDITEQVNKDLFEQKDTETEGKKKKRKIQKESEEKEQPKKQKLDSANIRLLNFKRLHIGMCTMGSIKEINDLELVISLPNGLTGFVSITEISEQISKIAEKVANEEEDEEEEGENELPELSTMFSIGQLISCAISELTDSSNNKKKINLSIKPTIVNANVSPKDISIGMMLNAEVISKEDHGYIMDIGVEGIKAFINNKQIKEYMKNNNIEKLIEGQVISCGVLSVDSGFRTVQLTLEQEKIMKSFIPNSSSPALTSLKPGALVNAQIKDVTENGLKCIFCGIFNSSIDLFNVSTEKEINLLYKEKQKVHARILYIDYSKLRIGLSLNQNLINYKPVSFENVRIGSIIDNVIIKRIDASIGTLVKINEKQDGYIHISRLDDKRIENIEKKFSVGSSHKGRVVGLDYLGGIIHLSFQKSILNMKYFTHDDIEIGAVMKGTITKLGSFGLLININEQLNALCPKRHFSDVKLKNPEKKFKIGTQIKFRVLEVDQKSKKIIITLKKSLVDSNLPIITSYSNIKKGMITMGTIEAVKPFGCIVKFYNQVRALAPIHELSEEYIKNPSDHFKPNQTIKCRVMDFDEKSSKLRVSFKLLSVEQQNLFDEVKIGSFVSGRVISVVDDGAVVELNDMNGLRGFLLKQHMSDFESNANLIYSQLKEGCILNKLMVLYKDSSVNQIFLTMKNMLITAMEQKELPGKFEDVKVNTIIPGYVKFMTNSYAIISFLDDLVGAVIKDNVSDLYVKNVEDFLQLGKSVIVLVTEIDKEKKHFNLSLKLSECKKATNAEKYINTETNAYFKELDKINSTNYLAKNEKERVKNFNQWKKLNVGGSVEGFVKTIVPAGTILELKNSITGLILNDHFFGEKKKVGETIKGRILDLDVKNNVCNISMLPNLMTGSGKKMSKELEVKGKVVDAVVQLVKENYIIVSLPKYEQQIAYITENSYNQPIVNHIKKYSIGQSIKANVISYSSESTGSFYSIPRLMLKIKSSTQTSNVVDTRRQIKEPIDTSLSTLDDIIPGKTIKAKVKGVKRTQINMIIGSNLKGRIHITEVYDKIEDVKDLNQPLKGYKPGDIITCRIIGVLNSKGYKYLPLTHTNPISQTNVELSIRPSRMELSENEMGEAITTIDNVKVDSVMLGAVQKVTDNAIWMYVSPQLLGRVNPMEISNNVKEIEQFKKNFKEGQMHKCYILKKNVKKGLLDISLRNTSESGIKDLDTVKAGEILTGKVIKVQEGKGINVRINSKLIGRVFITDICDKFKKNPTSKFEVGQIVSTCVLNVDKANKQLDLSLKASKINKDEKDLEKDADIQTIDDVSEDMIVYGYVKHISDKGCFVALSSHLDARVKIAELSDLYVKEWKTLVSLGQLVKGKVISVDKINKRVELTLKDSIVNPDKAKKIIQWKDLSKGQKVVGIIKGIEEYGVFIRIDNSNISGLCHRKELSDKEVKDDISKLYSVGDKVKAMIIKVDLEKKRVSFSLKASHFADDEDSEDEENTNKKDEDKMDEDEDDENMEEENEEDEEEDEDDDENEDDDEENDDEDDDDDDDDDDDEDEDEDVMDIDKTTIENEPKSLIDVPELEIGNNWEDDSEDEINEMEDDSDEDEDEDEKAKSAKKSKRAKKREKLENEERIREQEKMILDNDKIPEMADDFERLLLGSPNSSYLWIKYMAFQLHMAEIEKARQIAERALKTINYREEQEKMNVWIAYMNLENSYGSPETLLKVFDRAISLCDPKNMYIQLVKIYERSEKFDLAEQLYQTMIKRFRESSKIWCQCGLFYLKRKNISECRKILQRAIQSLAKRKHVKTICKFAQMEFRYGEPERGRTVFEGIMSNYPKRVDLWSIYLDMEIRQGDQNLIRRLFERVIHMKFSSKKMKFFFKRYLEYEKKHGDEETVNHVKEAAMEYIQSLQ